jgi:hypothetical protein
MLILIFFPVLEKWHMQIHVSKNRKGVLREWQEDLGYWKTKQVWWREDEAGGICFLRWHPNDRLENVSNLYLEHQCQATLFVCLFFEAEQSDGQIHRLG